MQHVTIPGPSVPASSMAWEQKVECNCSCREKQIKGSPSPLESGIGTDTQPPQAPKCESMEPNDQLPGTGLNQPGRLADPETVQDRDNSVNGGRLSPGGPQDLPDLIFPSMTENSPSSPDMSGQVARLGATLGGMFFSSAYGQDCMIDEPEKMPIFRMTPTFNFAPPYIGTGSFDEISSGDESWNSFDFGALANPPEVPMDFPSGYETDGVCVLPCTDPQELENDTLSRKRRCPSSDSHSALYSARLKQCNTHATRRASESDSDAKTRILGCPFYKWHPREHRECSKYVLKRLKDVKQHLKRNHGPPEFYCARCYITFSKAEDRDVHTRNPVCPFREKPRSWHISTETLNKLVHYSARTKSTEEQWFELWDTLFDGVPRPRSAYVGNLRMDAILLLRDLWEDQQDDLVVHAGRNSPGLKTVMEEMLNRLEAEA